MKRNRLDILSALITADTHFTLKQRDAHRLKLISWLSATAVECNVPYVFFLGDFTNLKDNHPSQLVNNLVDSLYELSTKVERVILLAGNHDFLDPTCPFFNFLSKIPNIEFISKVTVKELCGSKILFLPSSKEYKWNEFKFYKYDYVFLHHTFDGSIAQNGQKLVGTPVSVFSDTNAVVLSGDIHVPQKLGRIEYVGAPYHISFGDKYIPRVVLLRGREVSDLDFYSPRKLVLDLHYKDDSFSAGLEARVIEGDQVKVRIHMSRSNISDWPSLRQKIVRELEGLHVEVCGVELKIEDSSDKSAVVLSSKEVDGDIFNRFCAKEGITGYLKEVGKRLLT